MTGMNAALWMDDLIASHLIAPRLTAAIKGDGISSKREAIVIILTYRTLISTK